MVKVLGPLHSESATGSVAGISFKQHNGVTVAQMRSRPQHFRTPARDLVSDNLKAAQEFWRLLNNEENSVRHYPDQLLVSDWEAAAVPPLTGYTLWLSRALRSLSIGFGPDVLYIKAQRPLTLIESSFERLPGEFWDDSLFQLVMRPAIYVTNPEGYPEGWEYVCYIGKKRHEAAKADYKRRVLAGHYPPYGAPDIYFGDPFPNDWVTLWVEAFSWDSLERVPLYQVDLAPVA
jgi:hypothetical protein